MELSCGLVQPTELERCVLTHFKRGKHRRKSNLKIRFAALAVLIIVASSLVSFKNFGSYNPHKAHLITSTSVKTPAPSTTFTEITAPWLNSLNDAMSLRVGKTEGAVLDLSTGKQWQFGETVPMVTASIIKLTIAEAVLSSAKGVSQIGKAVLNQLSPIIEESSNSAATNLWNIAGASNGISKFDSAVGLTNTTPSSCVECPGFPWPGWGLTLTTPSDQIKILKNIFESSKLIPTSSRLYLMNLMSNVIPSERWGISVGPGRGAQIWLKNGWLPMKGWADWQINSFGKVSSAGHVYLIALLSSGNPTMAYGIESVELASKKIWELISSNYQ